MKKRYWLKGVIISGILYVVISIVLFLQPTQPSVWFSPFYLFQFFGGYIIQTIFNFVLGEDNFVEKYLIIESAFLSFIIAGALAGWIYGRIKNRDRTNI